MNRLAPASVLVAAVAFLSGAPALRSGESSGGLLETIGEFRRLEKPSVPEARRLRDRYSAQLGVHAPSDARFYATYPYYVLALRAMDRAVFSAVDFAGAADARAKRSFELDYAMHLAQLEILAEEIARLEKE